MFWESLIQNFGIILGIGETWAGVLVSMVIIFAIASMVWIITRGTRSDSKMWMVATALPLVFLFTLIGWMYLPVFVATLIFVIAYIANKIRIGGR